MRHGIAQLIEKEPDFEVCGEAGDRKEALDAIRRISPDFVILDISLKDPGSSGLDLISEIHSYTGTIPILIYSMHDENVYAELSLRSGASGYLMKQEPVRQIVGAVRRILHDGIYVSEEISRRLLLRHIGPHQEHQEHISPQDKLSVREFEVFRLIGIGMKPREIAIKLSLSVKTIETHRINIRKKLGMTNAPELTRYAIEWIHRKE